MNNFITFDRFRSVILQQGIVTQPRIQPDSDFRKDLNYKTGDLLELARLIEQTFAIPLSREQVDQFTKVHETISLLNRLRQLPDLVERLH